MIEVFPTLMREVIPFFDKPEEWDSLIINKRKPHTYRIFRQFGEYRVCLHRFEPCSDEDCFAHPHPWPGAFLLLQGTYIHTVGYSPTLDSDPTFFYREIVRPNTMYEIVHRNTWHKVQPVTTTWTIMINGKPWEEQHSSTRTTKGKDLEKMPEDELIAHLQKFKRLMSNVADY